MSHIVLFATGVNVVLRFAFRRSLRVPDAFVSPTFAPASNFANFLKGFPRVRFASAVFPALLRVVQIHPLESRIGNLLLMARYVSALPSTQKEWKERCYWSVVLVVTTDGLPLEYEVLAGNTADKTTHIMFLEKIQSMYGNAPRVWMMDRGIPTEATLKKMRDERMAYLMGTLKTLLCKLEKSLIDRPWESP